MAATLSEREREVFERLVLGASNAEIAEELVITIETVKTHVKRILRKIGAINRSTHCGFSSDGNLAGDSLLMNVQMISSIASLQ